MKLSANKHLFIYLTAVTKIRSCLIYIAALQLMKPDYTCDLRMSLPIMEGIIHITKEFTAGFH